LNEKTFERLKAALVCAALAILVLAIYWPLSGYPFISLDDPEYITQNPHVLSGLSWRNVAWAFSTGYAANWHPLTWISHMLDVQWFGLDAGRHHLVSVAFHAANTVLLFFVLRQLTGSFWRSALVAALFGAHPLHVESVAWAAERKDVLSGFFFLLTIWAYARFAAVRKEPAIAIPWKNRNFWLALIAFAFGLMSKPMLVTLPFVLLLLDFWPLRRFEVENAKVRLGKLAWEKAPFFLLALGSSVITYLSQEQGNAVGSVESLGIDARIGNAILSYGKYLEKTFWPGGLAVFYPHPFLRSGGEQSLSMVPIVLTILILAVLTLGILLRLRSQPYLGMGWLWFGGMLVPVIGIVQVGSQGMADRYMYLPMIGLLTAVVWSLAELWETGSRSMMPEAPAATAKDKRIPARGRRSRLFLGTGAAIAILLSGYVACKQVHYWRGDVSLFEHALAVTRYNPQAHFNVAIGYGTQGNLDAAIEHLQAFLAVVPNYPAARFNLGFAYMSKGQLDQAASEYEQAIRLQPGYIQARQNLGAVLMSQGKPDAALEQFTEAARLQPENAGSELNVGRALFALRRFSEAAERFREAVRLAPNDLESLLSLGTSLYEMGNTNEAPLCFAQALKIDPALTEKTIQGGKALLAQARLDLAQGQFLLAERLEPANAGVQQTIATIFAQQNRPSEAIEHFTKCLALRPDAESFFNLALACDLAGRTSEALTNYQAAVKLKPDWPVALNNLAWVLATAPEPQFRNGAEAVRLAERACELTGGKEVRYFGTLDAAYAEAGRFEDALKTAEKTRLLAESSGQEEIANAAKQRMGLYQHRQAFVSKSK
jgi:tetratricopeptide (TPR) repeat protein